MSWKIIAKFILGVFCAMIVFLPIYSVISGEVKPSVEHLQRAQPLAPNEKLVQIGFSSGSYSCNNGVCDMSNAKELKQYIPAPSFSKIISVSKAYDGSWSQVAEEFEFSLKVKSALIYLLAIFGLGYLVRSSRSPRA